MKTYVYGAMEPKENAQLVSQQIARAHRYFNVLTEIGRRRWDACEQILRPRRAMKPAERPPLSPDEKAALKAADTRHADEVRVERKRCGVYWGTYLCIEDAAMRAVRSKRQPSFRNWDGSGMVAVQFQGGLEIEELLEGNSRGWLDGEGRHRTLHLRVGSEGREPVWATFPIVYHRDLPSGAVVKWIRVLCRRVATHVKWTAQFILDEVPKRTPSPQARGTIAIDVGWRRLKDGSLRVASWVDNAGRTGEVRLPTRLLARDQKVSDLRSIRDRLFNEARDAFCKARSDLPLELRAEARYVHLWLRPARLAALTLHLRDKAGGAALDALEAWRKRDKHLLEWERHQGENVLRSRRELYRLFARFVADNYKRVVVEKLDLRDFAEHPLVGEDRDTPIEKAARPRRFDAGLSELFHCLTNTVRDIGAEWLEMEAAYTTQTCHACRTVEEFEAARTLRHRCAACGVEWDQDENAARNLLRAAESCEPAPGRSRLQTATPKGESVADRRRQKGLETRRALRSKKKK